MTRHRIGLLPAALVACLALVVGLLGSSGVSAAAGLTKKQVRAIATKVLAKEATRLTVARALDSDRLAGRSASAYLDDVRIYTSNIPVAVPNATMALPLTPGRYLVAWSAYLSLNAVAGRAGCYVVDDEGVSASTYTADDVSAPGTVNAGYSGTGAVEVTAGDTVSLYCLHSAGTFTTAPEDPVQVVVTPLDAVSSGTIAPVTGVRPTARAARP